MGQTARFSRSRAVVRAVALRPAFWERSTWHRLARLVLRVAYVYIALLLVLLFLENWLLFRALRAADSWSPPPSWCRVEDVWLTSADDTRIHGWWLNEPDWKPDRGAMVFCHGNGGNLSHRGDIVRCWVEQQHFAVLLIDYPGYGKSEGKSTEAGCYAAADAAYDWLTTAQHVAPERLVLYGGSLGGAVATDLAARRPHRALLLVSTFTTFPDIAQKQFPFIPARWLVRNRFDTLTKIRTLTRPVFFVHSDADGLIPYEMGKTLRDAATVPKDFCTLNGLHHDDGSRPDLFAPAFATFLNKYAP